MAKPYHFERLFSLGISPSLLKQAQIVETDVPNLYKLLRKAICFFISSSLPVNSAWQLQVLAKKSPHHPQITQDRDAFDANAAHYAAWAGDTQMLQWIKENQPGLLDLSDKFGRNIAHYAAWSGCSATLQWIKYNCPSLLPQLNRSKKTIAHYAAWSGSTEALQWIKDNYPELLKILDKEGSSIAHYSAYSDDEKNLLWIEANKPELLPIKNKSGALFVHFAAWSGNIPALTWIKQNYYKFLKSQDNDARTIAHYAAWSGYNAPLQWIRENKLKLLKKQDKEYRTIAHYGAWSGCQEIMQWIKEYKPSLLFKLAKNGANIAHFAARSLNPQMLHWVNENTPELMEARDYDDQDTVFYAALTGDPKQLNLALSLSSSPQIFRTPRYTVTKSFDAYRKAQGKAFHTLLQALETNYALSRVDWLETGKIDQQIKQQLSRNQSLSQRIQEFKFFARGRTQINGLNEGVLLEIFRGLLSNQVPSQKTDSIFKKVMEHISPQYTKIKTLFSLIENETLENRATQKELFLELKHQLTGKENLVQLKNILITFYHENEKKLNPKKKTVSFFAKAPDTSPLTSLSKIFQLLNIDEQDVSAATQSNFP